MTKFMMVRRLPFSPRFPYSTLFRSTRSKFCLADNSQGFLIRTAANTSDNNRVFNFPTFVHDKLNVNPPFNTCTSRHFRITDLTLELTKAPDQFRHLLYNDKEILFRLFFSWWWWWWWHIQRTTQIEFTDVNSNVFNNLIIRNFYRNRLTGWWWRCFNLTGLDNFFHLNDLLLVQNDHFRSLGNPVKFYDTNTN